MGSMGLLGYHRDLHTYRDTISYHIRSSFDYLPYVIEFSAGRCSRRRLFLPFLPFNQLLCEALLALFLFFQISQSVSIIPRIIQGKGSAGLCRLIQNHYIDMLPSLLTRRGGALRSCFQQCGSKLQIPPLSSFLRITESTVSHPRCMFATSRQLASKKTRFVQKKSNSSSKPARAALPNVPEIIPTYTSYVDNIALRKSPTLLFQSSSHIGYLVGCYTLGGLCFAYSVINFNNYYLHPPDGVWAPVPIFLGGLAVFMIGVGVFFCRRVSLSIY